MKMKMRKGFTLIELVIVVAIIGILALMILPQFTTVTQDAKNKQYESNCQTLVSAYAMYQAANGGDEPTAIGDLYAYTNGGSDAVDGPTGASYAITNKVLTCTYGDYTGTEAEYSQGGTAGNFNYPVANF